MKKYRLIKEYPGSPKLGSIIMDTNPNNGSKDSWFEENWGKANKLSFKLGLSTQPDRFPEFWEEVIELCVPIGTKFKYHEDNITIYTVESVNSDKVTISWKEGKYLESVSYSIKTVNENFKEGYWKEYKEVLFTTEDGVDIYEGDSYWYVDEEIELFFSKKAILTSGKDMFFKYFSTKEAAEEYILMNKPCLSIKEITPIVGKVYEETGVNLDSLTKNLKTLVKSKL